MDYVFQMKNVSKTFGEVQALHDINFEVGTNEIVGLLGDNGAGKSTLIKIITGYHQPDPGGELYWKGKRLEHLTVAQARELGINPVYQERALADQQSIWRNIFMGRELTNRFGVLDIDKMRSETQKLMTEAMGFTSSAVTPDSPVKTMSGGERQGVAITRALYFQAELIILDEPTMGLSLSETRKALDFVSDIKKAGKACIFIDHNIFHVYPVVDRIVVLDRGTIAGQFMKNDVTLDELIDRLYRVAETGELDKGHERRCAMSAEAKSHEAGGHQPQRIQPCRRASSGSFGIQIGIVAVALIVWMFFVIGSPRTFLSYPIYNAFMSTTPYFALIAIPLTLVVITKEIDLSFPSIMAWGMAIYALVIDDHRQSPCWPSSPAWRPALSPAGLNGMIVTKIGIPSLVATIGTQFFWRGVVLVMRNGNGAVAGAAPKASVVDTLLVGRLFDKIPAQFIWTIIIAIVIWFLLNRHRFGAHVYLTGDNEDSARLMGINVDRIKIADVRHRGRGGRLLRGWCRAWTCPTSGRRWARASC